MMKHSVANRRLVYLSPLRVADGKAFIRSVPVGFGRYIAMQCKDILFQVFLEQQNICLVPFVALELVPCRKQIFSIRDFIK